MEKSKKEHNSAMTSDRKETWVSRETVALQKKKMFLAMFWGAGWGFLGRVGV